MSNQNKSPACNGYTEDGCLTRSSAAPAKHMTTDMQESLHEFANGTSLHGIPRVINAKSYPARIFWALICLVAFSMFFWQCGILLHCYFHYPTKVSVEIVQTPVQFPSVSVCNADHLDISVVSHLEQLLLGEANNDSSYDSHEFINKYDSFREDSTLFFQYYIRNRNLKKARKDLLDLYSRLGLTANLGPRVASSGGIKLNEFIMNCNFMDEGCNITQSFSQFYDPYYFNCFTFKPQLETSAKMSRLHGVEYGLSLLLYTGCAGQITAPAAYDYVIPGMERSDHALANGRGARVIVHAPGTQPHPMAEGYDIPPGFSVTLGVKALENVRMGPPHSNCSDAKITARFNYTLIACQNQCIQRAIMQICGCVDNHISEPIDKQGLPYCFQLPQMPTSCNKVNFGQHCMDILDNWGDMLDCRRDVCANMTMQNPGAMDYCNCHPPCNDVVYDSSYSLSILPEQKEDTFFYLIINNFLNITLPKEKRRISRSKIGNLTMMAKQVSRVNVYIGDSNVIKTTESPDYESIRLISDIGGQLGLWIGISVMTLFEVLQLVAELCGYVTATTGRSLKEPL